MVTVSAYIHDVNDSSGWQLGVYPADEESG